MTTSAPAARDVAALVADVGFEQLREDASALGIAHDVLVAAAVHALASEVSRRPALPCTTMSCAGDGMRGELSSEHRRLVREEPRRLDMLCGACIDREVAYSIDVTNYYKAQRQELAGAAS